MIKKHVEVTLNVQDANSPKSTFRICVEHKLCSGEEGATLIKMANDRNITTHTYSIDEVREILPNIPKYYELMLTIVDRVEKMLSRA